MADVNTTGKVHIDGDVSGLEQANKKGAQSFDKLEGAAKEAASSIDKGLGEAIKDTGKLWQDANGRWRAEGGRFASMAEKMAAGVQDVGRKTDDAGRAFKGFAVVVAASALDIAARVTALGLHIGKALVAPIKQSVNLAGDFEGGMNQFAAAAGGSLDAAGLKLKDFEDLFIQMGKELPVSTMEVQQAATTLVKGGIDPAILAAGGLKSALQFAAGAEVDLTRAAEISVKQLSLFGDGAWDAAEKVEFLSASQDLLVKAGNASAGNVDQLSDAVLMSGGAANAAGLDYRDFIQMVTLVSDKMPSAAEAGTSFKNMLMQLNPRTRTGVEAFQELGLMTFNTEKALQTLSAYGIKPTATDAGTLTEELARLAEANGMTEKEAAKFMQTYQSSAFFNAKGEFIGGRDAIEKLRAAFVDLTDADKMRLAQMAFGNDGMNAAMALISGGTAEWDKYTQAIDNANGVAAQSEATQKGLNFMIDQFKGSLEALGIIVGQAFLPTATKIMEWGTGVLNGIEPLFNFLKNDSAIGLQTFQNVMSDTFGPTAAIKITEFVQNAKEIIQGLVAYFQGNPFNEAALSDALVAVFGEEGAIKIGEVAMSIKNAIDDVVTWINANWPTIQQTITSVVSGIVNFVVTNWPMVQAAIGDVITAIQGFINEQLIPAINNIMPHIQSVVTWIQTNWPMIQTIIGDVVNFVVGVFNELLLPVIGVILAAIGGLVAFIVENWPKIKPIIEFVVKAVKQKLDEVKTTIQNAFDQAKNAVKWMEEFVAEIAKGWNNVKKTVEEKWQEIQKWFDTLPTILKTIGDNMIKGLVEGIKAAGNTVFQAITGIVQGAIDEAKRILNIKSPSKEFEEVGDMTMLGFVMGIVKRGGEVIKAVQEVSKQAAQAAVSSVDAVYGSTAHRSPDAGLPMAVSGLGGLGVAEGLRVLPGRGNVADEAPVPAGLSRDDWDAHDRGDRATQVTLAVDGRSLGSVLIGRLGQVLQQDARRYGG